jgi:hypothetical protein
MSAVLPSADNATETPVEGGAGAMPLPTSFGPCWMNCASAESSGNTSAAPAIASRTIIAAPAVPTRNQQNDFREAGAAS